MDAPPAMPIETGRCATSAGGVGRIHPGFRRSMENPVVVVSQISGEVTARAVRIEHDLAAASGTPIVRGPGRWRHADAVLIRPEGSELWSNEVWLLHDVHA